MPGPKLLACSPLCHTDHRLIWRQWRSSFSAWLPWHLFLLCNCAEVEWCYGEVNVPLCIFTKVMKLGIHLSPGVLSLELFHLIFMHLNFHPVSSPLLATVSISQFLHSPNLLVLSPPFSRSSLRCQPPGLLDQRAFLWDHLERPVEVEKEKGRGRTQKRGGGGGEEGRSERLAESVGQGGVRRDSRKEVFLSRSTAAQSHTQYFPLAGTHFALTHTSAYSHACYHTAARTTAFDPRVF